MSESTEEARSSVAASPASLLVLDDSGRISDASPSACSLLGSARKEVLFQSLGAFVATPRTEDLLQTMSALPPDAEVVFRTELGWKDGTRRPVRLWISSNPHQRELYVRVAYDRRAEDRLPEESDFARAMLEASEGPVMVLNGQDRIVLANRACQELAGAPFSDLRGKLAWLYSDSPEESERAKLAVEGLRASGGPSIRATWRWRMKSGDARLVAWKLSLFRTPGSTRIYVLATGVDFTEPERVAEESHRVAADVRSALGRIRSVVDSVPALISYLDADRKYVFVNHRYEDWFGIPASRIEGRRIQDVVPKRIYDVLGPELDKAYLGETVSFETLGPTGEEGARWMEVTYIPDRDADGRVRGVFGQVQDVTKLRRLINATSEHQTQLQAIMDYIPHAITLVDLHDRFLMVDRVFEDLLDAPRPSLVGRSVRDVFPPAVADRILEENESVRRLRASREVEESLLTPRGLRTFLSVKFPLFHADGSLYAVGTVSSDITERKRAEVEVRWLNDRLEDRVRDRTQDLGKALSSLRMFIYGIAHNLRAPLRAMAGFGAALREDYAGKVLDEAGQDFARRLVEAARRQDSLIQGLLDFGRIASERVEFKQVSLKEVVSRALCVLAGELADCSARVTVDPDLPMVFGDQGFLELVLVQLLSNAVKFVAPGIQPRVAVTAEVRRGQVRIVVQDNGIGIPAEHHDRIFGVFEQLALPEAHPGTGIGLTIVQKAVERLGGRVDFESAPGKGSRFWVELPRARSAPFRRR